MPQPGDTGSRMVHFASDVQPTLDKHCVGCHGGESPERVRDIARRSGMPEMKALALAGEADLAAPTPFEGIADRLLFDAKPPKGATRPGGLGTPFDWSSARAYRGGLAWMLSGGLTPDNVAEAIATSGANAVDVSSGIESRLGVKDPGLIRRFIEAAREADVTEKARA